MQMIHTISDYIVIIRAEKCQFGSIFLFGGSSWFIMLKKVEKHCRGNTLHLPLFHCGGRKDDHKRQNLLAETHWLPHFTQSPTAGRLFDPQFSTVGGKVRRKGLENLPIMNRISMSCLRRARNVGALFVLPCGSASRTQMSGRRAASLSARGARRAPSAPRCGRRTRLARLCLPSSQVLCWK